MDRDKLEALQRKYAGTKGGDIFDPRFAAAAARVFATPDQRQWPFAGAASSIGSAMSIVDATRTPLTNVTDNRRWDMRNLGIHCGQLPL